MNLRSFTFLCFILSSSAFGPEQVGPCRGPGGPNDKVNSRSAIESTQEECQTACADLVNCVGYSYCSNCNGGECILYGSRVDGSCSDPSALNEPSCEAIGTCSNPAQLSEETCGTCSESTALSKITCGVVGATWTPNTWTSSNEVWADAEDPWTGESHSSTVIAGTTGETSSNYICMDADPEDHMAHCIGSETDTACTSAFDGLVESNRTDENCPDNCTFQPKPTVPKIKSPHPGDIKLPGWKTAMSGACRGGPDFTDKVNGKYSNSVGSGTDGKLTQEECAEACLDEVECIAYAHSTAWCVVYGPNVHDDPGDGWTSDQHEAVEITGTKANPSYICVTAPPRGGDSDGNSDDSSSGSTLIGGRDVLFSFALAVWGIVSLHLLV